MNTYNPPQDAPGHPTLILVRGIPGSGKTYLADRLKKALAAKVGAHKVVTIDPDATDRSSTEYLRMVKDLTAQGVDSKFYPYRFTRAQAHAGLEARNIIIWNQPFTDLDGFEKTIKNLRIYAAEHDTRLPVLVVEVAIDPKIARQRVAERKAQGGHGPSEATFDRFINDYISFFDKGHSTVAVHGEDDASTSILTILAALDDLQDSKDQAKISH